MGILGSPDPAHGAEFLRNGAYNPFLPARQEQLGVETRPATDDNSKVCLGWPGLSLRSPGGACSSVKTAAGASKTQPRQPLLLMAKKKKVRVQLRKNRSKPPRQQGWTRGFHEHGYEEDATLAQERVRAKGELSRKRTIIQ